MILRDDAVIGVSPFEVPDSGLVVAIARSNALGVLDLGRDLDRARAALAETARRAPRAFGVRVAAALAIAPENLPTAVDTVVVAAGGRFAWPGRRVLAEVRSVDDARDAIEALQRRFPQIQQPPLEDICYATTNRQEAVKAAARDVDAVIVVGAFNSSNSQRLREVAEREGCANSVLVPSVEAIDWSRLEGVRSVAVTAGASAPEILVEQILDGLAERFEIEVETLTTREESMFFPLPRSLRDLAPAAPGAV